MTEMAGSATQVMSLNGIAATTVIVQTCETNPGDSRLCTNPPRKLVRVIGSMDVPTIFLHLVGVNTIQISSNAIAEAASMDVVVVIDISESMAWDAHPGDALRDPYYCNEEDSAALDGFPGECQPFEKVKEAAISFVNRILDKPVGEEQDRVAIVTISNGFGNPYDPNDFGEGTHLRTAGWTYDRDVAFDILRNLRVYEADNCYNPSYARSEFLGVFGSKQRAYGPCRLYRCADTNWVGNGGLDPNCFPGEVHYVNMDCLSCRKDEWATPPPWDFELSGLPTTNIGGGLLLAGNMYAFETRPSALWVTVLLSDGMANTTNMATDGTDNVSSYATYPLGFCPNPDSYPLCVDWDVSTRHNCRVDLGPDINCDAEDYARDMADFVGCMPLDPADACNGLTGQGAIVFTIALGLGAQDHTNEVNDIPYGAALLRYIARVGYAGDPDPVNDPCLEMDESGDYTAWCGNYYFSPTGSQLIRIFENIASRIFTRIVQ
jgi:hypothetical protein